MIPDKEENMTVEEKIAQKVCGIMHDLQIPPTESNNATPMRIAKMWCNELFRNRNNQGLAELVDNMTLFNRDTSQTGSHLIIMKDIPFSSTCEHHWLPFSGTVTVGYVPDWAIIGLSKIPRVVKYFSRMPQLQEKFTADIGNFLNQIISPVAIFVEVEAKHQCVMCRGAESDCSTHTSFRIGNECFYQDFLSRL